MERGECSGAHYYINQMTKIRSKARTAEKAGENATTNLFLPSGYLNWDHVMSLPENFILIIGGRGTGKTYGALKWHVEHSRYFIFTRRTATQVKLCATSKLNPFKTLNRDQNWNYQALHVAEDIFTFTPCATETTKSGRTKFTPAGDDIATIIPLSTFSNTRGIDVLEARSWLVDELIPEKNERPIQNEGECYLNAFETMNRNRELEGWPPIKGVFMSNSNTLKNPLLLELELVGIIKQMADDRVNFLRIPERELAIIRLEDSPISELKRDTALYRLTKGTNFARMALDNEFAEDIASESEKLKDDTIYINFTGVCRIGEISIYKLKNLEARYKPYYISRSYHNLGQNARHYTADVTNTSRFLHKYLYLYHAYMRDEVLFEDYLAELLFQQYFHKY